jgi:hypothetical protein
VAADAADTTEERIAVDRWAGEGGSFDPSRNEVSTAAAAGARRSAAASARR